MASATDQALRKLAISNGGRYYNIRSDAPFGYLDKLCYMGDEKPATNALFEIVNRCGSGFVVFHAPFFNGSCLAVNTDNSKATTLKEREHFTGRLFLFSSEMPKKLDANAEKFELFVPIKTAFTSTDNNEGRGVRAIVRSVANQRFLVVKPGGSPFACAKDPSLATVFVFEQRLSFSSKRKTQK